jgi:hypothetical protein
MSLLAYQPLLSSYSQIHFASRLIEEADFKAVFRHSPALQLQTDNSPFDKVEGVSWSGFKKPVFFQNDPNPQSTEANHLFFQECSTT